MRIIAGQYKGRILLSPEGMTTRPITDRVKSALFNILRNYLADAVVLDLFCGTGSMGLESLSRGAAMCYFADRDEGALGLLKQNIQALGAGEHSHIWRGDINALLGQWLTMITRRKVDLAFLDPPYAMARDWDWDTAARQLFEPLAKALAADGLVILRCQRHTDVPGRVGGLSRADRRDYGTMSLHFFGLPAATAPAGESDASAPPPQDQTDDGRKP